MAQLRRKMRLAIQLYETTNSNRLKTGDPLTCELYPAGAQIETIVTVAAGIGITTDISCSGRGSLPVGASVRLIRDTGGIWADIAATDFTISSIEELGSAEGVFIYKIANTSATTTFATVIGDRIVAKRDATNRVTIYQDESDPADTVTQPIDVPTDGIVEGYVDERGLDVFLYGATITDNWTAFNVATSSGEIGPMRLKAETLAADALMNIDADTSVVLLNANTNPINLLEHCAPNRILILYPGAAGTQLTTFNTKGDNTIYEATGRTINLDQDEPFMLIGNAGAANVAYWSILATPALIDFGLDELSDVATAGAAAGEPLVYDGASWVPNSAIGTSAAPLTKVYAADNGLILGTAGSTAQITTSNLTGARVYSFPDSSTALLGVTGNADVFGLKRFIVGGSGFKMSEIGFSRIAEFDVSGITAATTRIFTFPDKNGILAVTTDLRQSLESLDDTTIAGAEVTGLPLSKIGAGDYRIKNVIGSAAVGGSLDVTLDHTVGLKFHDEVSARSHSFVPPAVIPAGLSDTTIPILNGGTLVNDEYNPQVITMRWQFDEASATKWGMFQTLSVVRNGMIFFRVPSSTYLRDGIKIRRVTWDWTLLSPALGAVATQLNLYWSTFAGYPLGAAVPPGGGTAILATNMNAPTGAATSNYSSTTTFADDTIQNDSMIYLGVAAANNDPQAIGTLNMTMEYTNLVKQS